MLLNANKIYVENLPVRFVKIEHFGSLYFKKTVARSKHQRKILLFLQQFFGNRSIFVRVLHAKGALEKPTMLIFNKFEKTKFEEFSRKNFKNRRF